MTWVQHLSCTLLLLLAVAVEYRSMVGAGFVFADDAALARAQSGELSERGWLGPRRWTLVSLRLSPSPAVQHAINMSLHAAATLLAAFLIGSLAGAYWGWVAAIVMACHPLHVEAVMYISGGRGELLAAIGVLLAALAATWSSRLAGPAALVAIGIGFCGKESAIVGLPIALLVGWRLARIPGWMVVVSLALVLLVSGQIGRTQFGLQPSLRWTGMQSLAAVRETSRIAWPRNLTVDVDYDTLAQQQPGLLPVSMAAVGLTAGLAMWLAVRAPGIAMALGWLVCCLSPRLLVPTWGSYLNDHQMYLATLSPIWLAVRGKETACVA